MTTVTTQEQARALATPITTVEDRILVRSDLCEMLGVSSETIRRWLNSGALPKPDIALSRKTQAWRLSSLNAAGIGIL